MEILYNFKFIVFIYIIAVFVAIFNQHINHENIGFRNILLAILIIAPLTTGIFILVIRLFMFFLEWFIG